MATTTWHLQDTVIFELGLQQSSSAMETDDTSNNVFVNEATWSHVGNHFAVGGSNGDIKIYDFSNERGASLAQRIKHGSATPAIRFDRLADRLWSCGDDGTIKLWDPRSTEAAVTLTSPKKFPSLLSCDVNSNSSFVAAGTAAVSGDTRVLIWDLRSKKQVAEFQESHSDDVTQIRFHPTDPLQLVSGSEDGLISTFILRNDFDEEESLESVMNTGQTPAKIGYFGENSEFLYCTTNVQSFAIWKHFEATKVHDFGDMRTLLSPNFSLDYLIDCQYDAKNNNLFLFAGTYDGNGEVFRLETLQQLQHCFSYKNGHSETIRSAHINLDKQQMVTVGEDSRMCIWGPNESTKVEARKPKALSPKPAGFNPYKKK